MKYISILDDVRTASNHRELRAADAAAFNAKYMSPKTKRRITRATVKKFHELNANE